MYNGFASSSQYVSSFPLDDERYSLIIVNAFFTTMSELQIFAGIIVDMPGRRKCYKSVHSAFGRIVKEPYNIGIFNDHYCAVSYFRLLCTYQVY